MISNRSINVPSPGKPQTFTELALHIPERKISFSKPASPLINISSYKGGARRSPRPKELEIDLNLDHGHDGSPDMEKTVKNGKVQNLTKTKINESFVLKQELAYTENQY